MRSLLLSIVLLCFAAFHSAAQQMSVSTNLIDYACLGTLNAEASFSVSQHWSVTAGVKYNPFTYRKDDPQRQFQYRQQSYAIGARFWPWHSFSGWWLAAKAKYQEYNYGGIISPEAEEGDRAGVGLYAGYTHMISRHFNIEFGLGAWSGMGWYRRYSCPSCGLTVDDGRKWFLLPDDVMISFAYVF